MCLPGEKPAPTEDLLATALADERVEASDTLVLPEATVVFLSCLGVGDGVLSVTLAVPAGCEPAVGCVEVVVVVTLRDKATFLSISSRMPLGPLAASSFCFRSRSAACFCFHASNFASLSAFFCSSVWAGVTVDACLET